MASSSTDGSTNPNGESNPNISSRMRRIEAMFFMIAVPFVAYMSTIAFHGYGQTQPDANVEMQLQLQSVMTTMQKMQESMSSISEVKATMSSLQEIQDAVSSLREQQDTLAKSIASDKKETKRPYQGVTVNLPKEEMDSSQKRAYYERRTLSAMKDNTEYRKKSSESVYKHRKHRKLQTDTPVTTATDDATSTVDASTATDDATSTVDASTATDDSTSTVDASTATDDSVPSTDDEIPFDDVPSSTDDISPAAPEDAFAGCTTFRFELDTDGWPEETHWELLRLSDNEVIANISYTTDDNFITDIYEDDCLEPGSYSLTIFDSNVDGIQCLNDFDGLPCYNVWVNGDQAETSTFAGSFISLEFNSKDLCVFQPVALLLIYFDPEFSGASWSFLDEADGTPIVLEETFEEETVGDAMSAYFTCLLPGVYSIEVADNMLDVNSTLNATECENECYELSVTAPFISNPTYSSMNVLDGDKKTFYVSIEGISRERNCLKEPIIAPINTLSSFEFDARVSQILNVIQAHSKLEAIFAQGTNEYKATCYILYDDALKIGAEDPRLPERYVLSVFLYATGQLPEVQMPLDPCVNKKFGCNEDGFITSIDWSREGFKGFIPTEIAHLSELVDLKLKGKQLQGTIPTEFLRLSKLVSLDLSENLLTGTIPSELGGIKSLETISLRVNSLSNRLPTELAQLDNLFMLDVNANQLTGTIPMLSKSVNILSLGANMLTGTIPTAIGLLENMWIFYSENNKHHGKLPTQLGGLLSISLLDLSFNELSGTIPAEFNNAGLVDEINLKDNFLTGSIPELHIGDLLYLSNNSLEGVIPASIFESNLTALKLEDNNLVGAVTEDFCANLSFAPGFEGIYDLTVDDSHWFLDDPLVECPCCDDVNCHLWKNMETIIVGGTQKPDCKPENVFTFDVFERYVIIDQVANVTSGEGVGSGILKEFSLCLSPTGCFELLEESINGRGDNSLSWDSSSSLAYSASSRSLERDGTCDAVNVCGTLFAPDDPKRAGINHLTHIVVSDLAIFDDPSSLEYKAMCWLMTEDTLFHEYDVCDGTLLQRYVMALLYISQEQAFSFDVLPSDHTCEWPGVTCDEKNRYIERLELPSKNLTGMITTEIGLLTRLHTLDLSKNALTGLIDPVIFDYLPHLEVFHLGENELGGTLPKDIFILPKLKALNISNNLLVSTIPDKVAYTNTLLSLDLENNLLTGTIPSVVVDCPDIEEINLSRNNIKGAVYPEFGDLRGLKALKLNQNSLSGSIPENLFKAVTLHTLQLQSNGLTGSVPFAIGELKQTVFIALNHNSLKGPIPQSFVNLTQIEYLHLHANTLTGDAPELPHLRDLGDDTRYMTDCGSPSYALAVPIKCETCTTCCNSDGMCQTNRIWPVPIETTGFIIVFSVPLVVAAFLLLIFKVGRKHGVSDPRDPLLIFDTDSTYCLILSSNKLAFFIYTVTFFVQGCFYYVFLLASSFTHISSDWQFTLLCPNTNIDCNDQNTLDKFGWFLFYVVTLSSLGVEIANSAFQLRKGVFLFDYRLLLSGSLHLGMTVLAIFASVYYNLALATSNTELIVNAVILLFINDLDEQFMNFLHTTVPTWVEARIEEITENMETKVDRVRPSKNSGMDSDDSDDDDDDDEDYNSQSSSDEVLSSLAGSFNKGVVHKGIVVCSDDFDE